MLIDILLLAKGNHLLKCAASVGEYGAWFNPDIEMTDFGVESKFIKKNHFLISTGFEKLDASLRVTSEKSDFSSLNKLP